MTVDVIAPCLYVGESECTVLSSQYISEQDRGTSKRQNLEMNGDELERTACYSWGFLVTVSVFVASAEMDEGVSFECMVGDDTSE